MESNSSSNFPANYVTLKDLKERWLKRKQDEEDEKLRKLRAEEEEKLRKIRQEEEEKLRKIRQEEEEKLRKLRAEEEEKLRKIRQEEEKKLRKLWHEEEEEENKTRKPNEELRPAPKSKRPSRPARKYASSPGAEKKLADEAKGSEAMPPIAGRRNARNRGSAIHGIHPTPRVSRSLVKIEEKKAEKQGKMIEGSGKMIEGSGKVQASEIIGRVKNIAFAGANDRQRMRKEFGKERSAKMQEKRLESPEKGPREEKLESSGKNQTAEIIQRVANIEVAGGNDVRRGRFSWRGGGNGNSQLARKSRFRTSEDGMVWVRKTTDA